MCDASVKDGEEGRRRFECDVALGHNTPKALQAYTHPSSRLGCHWPNSHSNMSAIVVPFSSPVAITTIVCVAFVLFLPLAVCSLRVTVAAGVG